MATEERKAMSRQAIGMWAGGAEIDASIFTADYTNHQEPAADGGVRTIELSTWISIVEANHRAFADLSVHILKQLADGDQVATHWRFSATQTGAYEGREATGKPVAWTGVQIDRFADGRIAESWVVWDKYSMFEQLDLISVAMR
ncbi:ester cyclase [Bauldia sp.]|uniref:ester cyclase n=1 Tax=Bauldia sp. TaxID=2575872 RepID=UPI003BAB6A63